VSDRLFFLQSDRWQRTVDGGTGVYDEKRCCYCCRPVRPDAVRLRVARTNDGEWWLVASAADLSTPEWKDFQRQVDGSYGPTLLPIGPDCLRQHPEFEIGRVV
jgi:hypothetical protein